MVSTVVIQDVPKGTATFQSFIMKKLDNLRVFFISSAIFFDNFAETEPKFSWVNWRKLIMFSFNSRKDQNR